MELFGAAFVASVLGSMVGLGGGFVLVPILRLVLGFSPAEAAGTSLVLIVANSASGAFTYLLHQRVHVRLGALIALGALPTSIAGAMLSLHISPRLFDVLLAALLIAITFDMLWNAQRRIEGRAEAPSVLAIKGMSNRLAVSIGLAVGIFLSLFGLGGGIIVVPTFLYFSELPLQAISATSQFAILLSSPPGLITHILQHDVAWRDAAPLVAGGLLGGPVGARLSLRLKSRQLLVAIALALGIAALSLIWRHA
ncbi:MAG: sulfite exporter TauE/SafE family protein [Candidatus Eremiobacteraeota bacterium]|nr:sulfite exporter TauE/SafE family protein [Candidatus Eremiobacteraeota bacterium]MBV9057016.1 sulfite exporter TauE/SafE family protein [Candidatus Eremiobacteraeota bacterium]MBV9699095.1 sulfite exporter TauE/SafE family protein [Candidatus Eremiobacteraeota bacterium]